MKQLFQSFDEFIAAGPTRNQLLMGLAALLSREAIVRGLLELESAGPSFSPAATEGDHAPSLVPQKR